MQFHIENEIARRCRAPALNRSQVRHGIERRIDFDHFEVLRVPSEALVSRHFLWIPALDETGIGPACRADKNFRRWSVPAHALSEAPPAASATSARLKSLFVAGVIENKLRI